MSAGSQTNNRRYTVVGPYNGFSFTIGSLSTKTWSGTNYPSGRKALVVGWRFTRKGKLRTTRKSVYIPPDGFQLDLVHPDDRIRFSGLKSSERAPTFQRPRRVLKRIPGRARIEEHPYSVTFNAQTIGLVTRMNLNTRAGNNYQSTGDLNFASTPTGWTSNDDLALLGKLRERVAGSDFNAGVFLGEGHEALAMIANAAQRIGSSIRALHRGHFVDAARDLIGHRTLPVSSKSLRASIQSSELSSRNTLSGNWLQLQYGWLPLLQDAHAGAEFLSHHLSVPLQQIVTVSRQSTGSASFTSPSNAVYNSVACYRRKTIKAILKEKDVYQLSGLTDPLSVAWELVPFSFVADWFIPIGNYLSARGLSQALTGTFVTSTLDMAEGIGYKNKNVNTITNALVSVLPTPRQRLGSFTRTVSTSLSVPAPSMKPLSSVLSWQHAANSVALLSQVFAKKSVT